MLSEGFFVDHERHPLRVAAVAALQHVDRALDAAPGHADVGVGGEAGGPRGRGGVGEEPQLRQERLVPERAVVGQGLSLEDVERRPGDPALPQRLRQRLSSTTGPRAVFTR